MQNIDTPPLVSIFCITYNHSSYIRQCLDGFLIQKTNFPFEVLIHDDASTDDTAGIIKEYEAKYPDIIKPIYQVENQYSKGLDINIVYNLPRARGKYIAMCEGDDYWTDPLKLQKQVDFLESHTDYSMCFHSVWKLENGNTTHFVNIAKSEISVWDIINNWLVPTCSVLYRKISLDLSLIHI